MIYLASPYSHDDPEVRQYRFEQAEAYTLKRLLEGANIFSPIVYTHALAVKHNLPFTAADWSAFNNNMILVCQEVEVLLLPGWDKSLGVTAEINLARQLKKKVTVVWPE